MSLGIINMYGYHKYIVPKNSSCKGANALKIYNIEEYYGCISAQNILDLYMLSLYLKVILSGNYSKLKNLHL